MLMTSRIRKSSKDGEIECFDSEADNVYKRWTHHQSVNLSQQQKRKTNSQSVNNTPHKIECTMALTDTTTTACAQCVVISTRAINARLQNIATQHAKRNTDQSIKKHVREELLNYTMKHYSRSLLPVKSVQFAFYHCHWI